MAVTVDEVKTHPVAKPTGVCVEGKTPILYYPYPRAYKTDKAVIAGKPWVLAVCMGCHANEILPDLYELSTTYRREFPQKLWKRFHGYQRLEGQDPLTKKAVYTDMPGDWGNRPCLKDAELTEHLSQHSGKSLEEVWTLYEPIRE